MVKADILILCMNSFKSFKISVSFWVQVLERQERPGVVLLPLMVFQKHKSFRYFCITSILVLLDNHIIFLYRMFSLVQDVMEKAWEIRCTQLKQLVLCDLCLACFRCWIVFRKFWQWLFFGTNIFINSIFNYANLDGKKKKQTTSKHPTMPFLHTLIPVFLWQLYRWWYMMYMMIPTSYTSTRIRWAFAQIPFLVLCQNCTLQGKKLSSPIFPCPSHEYMHRGSSLLL